MTTLQEAREMGIGTNFTALNPADGFRQDNTLWFGTCSECGERITHSLHNKFWAHTIYLTKGWFNKSDYDLGLSPNHTQTYEVDYCPVARGEVSECVSYYKDENGNEVVVDNLLDK